MISYPADTFIDALSMSVIFVAYYAKVYPPIDYIFFRLAYSNSDVIVPLRSAHPYANGECICIVDGNFNNAFLISLSVVIHIKSI